MQYYRMQRGFWLEINLCSMYLLLILELVQLHHPQLLLLLWLFLLFLLLLLLLFLLLLLLLFLLLLLLLFLLLPLWLHLRLLRQQLLQKMNHQQPQHLLLDSIFFLVVVVGLLYIYVSLYRYHLWFYQVTQSTSFPSLESILCNTIVQAYSIPMSLLELQPIY